MSSFKFERLDTNVIPPPLLHSDSTFFIETRCLEITDAKISGKDRLSLAAEGKT
ncbi:MAG TPA: hypothetical protein VMD99_06140 [Terriglobales bacterium]|nr:hypothetical protein [Terriglobales bacterium]